MGLDLFMNVMYKIYIYEARFKYNANFKALKR